jgi:hypothetical protein
MRVKFELSWDVSSRLYYALGRPVHCFRSDKLNGILSQWSLFGTTCLTFLFGFAATREGRAIHNEGKGSTFWPTGYLMWRRLWNLCTTTRERSDTLHHTLHTIFSSGFGQSANVHEYPIGASVFSVEFLLNGIVIQKLEHERWVNLS